EAELGLQLVLQVGEPGLVGGRLADLLAQALDLAVAGLDGRADHDPLLDDLFGHAQVEAARAVRLDEVDGLGLIDAGRDRVGNPVGREAVGGGQLADVVGLVDGRRDLLGGVAGPALVGASGPAAARHDLEEVDAYVQQLAGLRPDAVDAVGLAVA